MTDKKYGILIIAGGSPRNLSSTTNINKLIRILTTLSQNVYLLSPCDLDLINLKKGDIFKIQTFQNRYQQFIQNQFLEAKGIFEIFKKKKIDIVFFAMGHDLNLVPILFSKIMGKKILLRSDGRPSIIIDKYFENQSVFKKYFFRFIENINYRLADIIISENNYMLKEYKQLNLYNCHVANLSVNIELFKRKNLLESRKYDLGYIGRFDKDKGILNFIAAIPLIIRKHYDVSVLIGGDGDLKEEIIQFIIKNKLERNILLVDWIQHENLPDYLNSIKVFVLPTKREGLPNIILEAMACGGIVLSTPVGGVPGVVVDSETGFIMENNSIPCIAKNIFRIMDFPNLENIADNAHDLIKNEYSFDSTLQKYNEIIDKI
jgi:glycosyltransferase involved in cell wall biosynthesis